jgi:excisionase family DNA binding protein
MRDTLKMGEVMELTGFSRAHIYRLVHNRDFPAHKPTGGRLFFFADEVDEYLSRGKIATNEEVARQAYAILNGEQKGIVGYCKELKKCF